MDVIRIIILFTAITSMLIVIEGSSLGKSKGDLSDSPEEQQMFTCLAGVPGTPGLNGQHGKDGMHGVPGASGPMGVQGPPGRAGESGKRGRKGDPGDPGRDGTSGLPGIGIKGDKGEAGSSLRTSRHVRNAVAFSASRSNKLGPVIEDTAVIFDRVFSNLGNGFNSFTSEFQVKTNGTYMFHLHVMSQENENCYTWIMHNRKHLLPVFGDSRNGYGTGSTSVIVDLAADDKVWVLLSKDSTLMNDYTVFSGYLLA